MNKIIISLIVGLMLIALVSANEYAKDVPVNLQFTCTIDGLIPENTTKYNISIYDPSGAIVVDNVEATSQGYGLFNYTFTFLQYGTYTINQLCVDGIYGGSSQETIEIIGVGNTPDKGITEVGFFIGLALLLSIFVFIKLSKLFSGFMILILGLGILFTINQNGWVGWIIFAMGFIIIMYALITPKKRRGY